MIAHDLGLPPGEVDWSGPSRLVWSEVLVHAERNGQFERAGVAIAKLAVDSAALKASVVKRPSRSSPEWTHKTLSNSAQLRDWTAELKKKLAGWSDRDE